MKMNKTIGIAISSALLSACASAPPPPPPKPVAKPVTQVRPSDPMKAANMDAEKGDWAAALRGYDAILAKQPNDPSAKFNRAVALHRLGKRAEAKAAYQGLVNEQPDNAEAVLNLGGVLREDGDLKGAIKLYTKFLKKNPWDSRVLNNLSVLYRESKEFAKAIETIRTLLMRDQNNIDAYKNLALVYYDQKKYRLAQTILGNAVQMAEKQKKEDPDIHVNLGLTHLALGKKDVALVSFKRAAEIDPNHVVANFNIGAIALEHRDYGLAERSFGVAIKKYGDDFDTNAALGYAYQGLQKYDEAVKQLEKANQIDPKNEEVVQQIVIVQQAKNDPDAAIIWADKYLQMKGIKCTEEDFDGFCGRYNGIKMMKQMAAEPPPEEAAKPKNDGSVELFTGEEEAPAEGAEGGETAAPEGQAAPAEGPEGAAPPSSGGEPAPEGQ